LSFEERRERFFAIYPQPRSIDVIDLRAFRLRDRQAVQITAENRCIRSDREAVLSSFDDERMVVIGVFLVGEAVEISSG